MANLSRKQQDELSAVRDFFAHMCWDVLCADSLDKPGGPARPDVRVRARVDGRRTTIGVEVTEYTACQQVRNATGGWDTILAKLNAAAASCPAIEEVRGRVEPRDDRAAPPKSQSDHFVRECVQFVCEQAATAGGQQFLHGEFRQFGSKYPLLHRYVEELCLKYVPGVHDPWALDNTGFFGGPEWTWVECRIREKAKKRRGYDCTGTGHLDATWLLICSFPPAEQARSLVGTSMSPFPPAREDMPADVAKAIKASGFDRVFLYNSMPKWALELGEPPPG